MCSLAVDLSCWELGQLWREITGLQFSRREWCTWVYVLTSLCGWELCWKKGACFQEMCGATSLWYDFEPPPSINPQPKHSQGDAPCVRLLYEDKTSNYLVEGPPLTEAFFVCLLSTAGQVSFPAASTDTPCPFRSQHRFTTTGGLSRTCSLPINTPLHGKCWGWKEGVASVQGLWYYSMRALNQTALPCVLWPSKWVWEEPLAAGSQRGVCYVIT